jgi:hypothetical protein
LRRGREKRRKGVKGGREREKREEERKERRRSYGRQNKSENEKTPMSFEGASVDFLEDCFDFLSFLVSPPGRWEVRGGAGPVVSVEVLLEELGYPRFSCGRFWFFRVRVCCVLGLVFSFTKLAFSVGKSSYGKRQSLLLLLLLFSSRVDLFPPQ